MCGLPDLQTKMQADFRDLFREAAMSDATSTVLVIDDDPDLRASVGRLLRSLGINVQLFASISDFLKFDPPDCPTCLVLDIRLPGQSERGHYAIDCSFRTLGAISSRTGA